MIINLVLPRRHLVNALLNDAQRLSELLNTAKVAVVAVSVFAYWHVKLDLVVGVVGGYLADVPGYAGASKHDAGEAVVLGFLGCYLAYADGA